MTPQDPALYPFDSLTFHADEIQAHLQKYILHGEIGRHATGTYRLGLFAFGGQPIPGEQVHSTRFM